MDPHDRKRKLILRLVLSVVAFIPVLVWIAVLESRRQTMVSPVVWGSPEELLWACISVVLLGMILRDAFLLQKVMEQSISGTTVFQSLSPDLMIPQARIQRHFAKTIPRPGNPELLSVLWASVFPVPLRYLMAIMIPLILLITGMLFMLSLQLTKQDRVLNKGPVITVTGVVVHTKKKSSRAGTYIRVDYGMKSTVSDASVAGTSYADHFTGNTGDPINVECLKTDPSVHRIKGMRTTPVDMTMPLTVIIALTAVMIPGLGLYVVLKKRYLVMLLTEGHLVHGYINRIRKGGRGTVFARAGYELNGHTVSKRIAHPLVNGLYETLKARVRDQVPVLLLIHPTRFKSVYLIEPHLKYKA